MPAASMEVIFNMHQFFVLVSLFFPIKKASALMFLLSNYTDISVKGVFNEINIEMSSAPVSSGTHSLPVILMLNTSLVLGQ